MRRIFLTFISVCFIGCVGDDGVADATILQKDDPAALQAVDSINDKTYTIALAEGQFFLDSVFFAPDDNENIGVSLFNNILLDMVNDQDDELKAVFEEVPAFLFSSETFLAKFQIFNGQEGEELEGLVLQVEGTVTLTDNTVVNLSAALGVNEIIEQEFSIQVDLVERLIQSEFAISFEKIFSDVDFDTLGAGGVDIVIEAGTENAEIDAALETIQNNLSLIFAQE